ncbi:metallo-mystery pair system four-Cys motif protein [Pyxidicoccus fallax]|uniref:Metallo-mystery pair system four-Cys motif protein n=1 Tax=Pyxidicoccus fallax TaxID=394095 RepID=A0A848M0F2_9BACT|nr:MbnP family copper-binding protein [Pyxidicoccus fallax]NMO22864.1 metallo-mystery pair system four-Cys motif protein [Pyxidicoccus fallax]NPC85148.1 metallo-mystery pair system four-Cys motif protein [Pyxidicoccus fallax]
MSAVLKSASWWLLPSLLLMQGCGESEKTYTVRFSPQVREQALACGTSYTDIGTSRGVIDLVDFRAYVRDVTLVRANGERHPLALDQDGTWQRDNLALLDFVDGTGECVAGNPGVRAEVVGTAPEHDDYTALEFKLGLPPERNHLNGPIEPAPLNAPQMWWSWQGGFKFVKLDVRSRTNELFYFHLGAAGCTGSVAEGYTCGADNQVTVLLNGFNPDTNQVVLDIAGLYSGVDVERVPDGVTDSMPGCMSGANDPECPLFFEHFGLTASTSGGPQTLPATFFRVR